MLITDWNDKKILVTGGSGFIGHATVSALQSRGVAREKIYTPRSADFNLMKETEVQRLFAEYKPDIVFHLAARVGGIYANMTAKAEFYYENVMMNTLMVEHAYRNGVKKMMLMGSGCIYPRLAKMPVKEEELWNGFPEDTNAPYAIAKRGLLVQSQAYREQYGFDSVYVMPGNVYGPFDNFHYDNSHVVPALIRKFVEAVDKGDSEVVCWGDGSPTRDFIYVDDIALGMILTMEKWDSSEPLNLSEGVELTIKELVETVAQVTGFKGKIVWDASRPNGQPRKALDVTRAKNGIGFETKMPLLEGLVKTMEWFKANRDTFRR